MSDFLQLYTSCIHKVLLFQISHCVTIHTTFTITTLWWWWWWR